MLKFGNTFLNVGGTYLTGFEGPKYEWVNIYSPASGLFPGSAQASQGYNYVDYIPSAANPGEQWLDGTQDLFAKSLGTRGINYASLSSDIQINLTEEMKSHDEYLLVNFCCSPWGVSYSANAYTNSAWFCEFGINDNFKTSYTPVALTGYMIKPDYQKEVKDYTVVINSAYNFGALQNYFPNHSRDVKKFRYFIDMKTGNYSGYMTSSMIQDMSDATYKFTSSCDPITLGDTINLSLRLKAPITYTTGTYWQYAGWTFGGFSMSSNKGRQPTEEEILSL